MIAYVKAADLLFNGAGACDITNIKPTKEPHITICPDKRGFNEIRFRGKRIYKEPRIERLFKGLLCKRDDIEIISRNGLQMAEKWLLAHRRKVFR